MFMHARVLVYVFDLFGLFACTTMKHDSIVYTNIIVYTLYDNNNCTPYLIIYRMLVVKKRFAISGDTTTPVLKG